MIDLKNVINNYPDSVSSGKKLKSVLLDLYPDEKLYGSLLAQILDDGIVDEIRTKKEIDVIEFINLCNKIEKNHGIAHKYIEGCLTIWATAFDIPIKTRIAPIKRDVKKLTNNETAIHKHKYIDTIVPPTCTEKGYTLHYCNCGYEYKDNFVNAKHDYVLAQYTEPTCEIDGKELYKCIHCGEEKTEIVKAIGHKFTPWIEQEKPSCKKNGYELRQCQRCCKTETRIINATGHHYSEWKQDKNGFFIRDCDKCGKTEKFSEIDYYLSEAENYGKGNGVRKDSRKSYQFYKKAALKGNIDAMIKVAEALQDGNGVQRNFDNAIEWYKKAADNGSSAACIKLGQIYMRGMYGGMINETLAEKYFNKALTIDPNNVTAKSQLNELNAIEQRRERAQNKENILLFLKVLAWIVGIVVILLLLLRSCF